MSRSLKSTNAFSRKVIPLGWRDIIVPNVDELRFLGKTNLEAILKEWKILNYGYSARLNFINRYNGAYYSTHQIADITQSLSNSEYAIKLISEILPQTEPKPLFATHRSVEETFFHDEFVFAAIAAEGAFFPATIVEQQFNQVIVKFDTLEGMPNGVVDYDSPLLLKPDELKYLAEHPDYSVLYACASGFSYKEDVELIIAMIEDCAKTFYDSFVQNINAP